MKRAVSIGLMLLILLSCISIPTFADPKEDTAPVTVGCVVALRAGGGSAGGSGGGGGGSSGGHHTSKGSTGRSDPLSTLFAFMSFLLIGSATTIVYRLRLSKYARNTKRLMRLLQKKDSAWKYKHIQKQVRSTYFSVQKAWTNLDMKPTQALMSDELYESFQTKLSWLKYKSQKNVLKHVRLLEAIPVAVYDDRDDSLDFVWFYIKGRMIDYTIDTETNAKIDGSTFPERFAEYWQFTRTNDNRWVLNRILQEDEADEIVFTNE